MTLTDLAQSPTFRATKGRVPIFRPLLNGEDFEVTITDAKVTLMESQHDEVRMSCVSSVLENTDGILDSPISFFYGQAPRTEFFAGYVTDVSEPKSGEGSLTFSLTILGATKVMQYTTPRFWNRRDIPSVVENLAYLNGLGFTGHPHSQLWTLAQTDATDWSVANSITGRLGWSLYNRYGVLMCYNSVKLFTESGSYARLQSSQNQDFDFESDRRLIDFLPTEISDENPNRMGAQVAYFTTNGQVQVARQSGDFPRYRFYSNYTIRDLNEAQTHLAAIGLRMDSWKQIAIARIWGDSDILPGMAVDVLTSNLRYPKDKFNGRWLVRGVTHAMDRQQFQTQLSLSRPSNTSSILDGPYQSFWNQAGRSKPTLSLQDGKWVSSWTNPTVQNLL